MSVPPFVVGHVEAAVACWREPPRVDSPDELCEESTWGSSHGVGQHIRILTLTVGELLVGWICCGLVSIVGR